MVVLSDVANALGYRQANRIGRHVWEKFKGTHAVGTVNRGTQSMTCITKKGLLESLWYLEPRDPDKKSAVADFRDWALEVIVDVMETGYHDARPDPGRST